MKAYVTQIDGYETILSDIEKRQINGTDCRAEKGRTKTIVDRLHPAKLDLTVTEKIPGADGSATLRLESKNGYLPPFQAGQYINVIVQVEGVLTTRPYSISSSPHERDYYEITVARIAGGFVSDYLIDNVQPGDSLESSAPSGHFVYNPTYQSKDLVFIAGGSGITPFMSMIRDVLETKKDRQIHLLYGNRTEESSIFLSELKDLAEKNDNFNMTNILSEPPEGYDGPTGFIDGGHVRAVGGSLDRKNFFICGPQVMYDFCLKELSSLGIKERKIRREMFGARQDIQNEPGWPEKLTGDEVFDVKVGDMTIPARSGESLLTAIERAGLSIEVCCRSGECSLCRVKLVSGEVFQPRGVLLRYSDEKFGYIHSCKSYPMSDLEIIL